MRSVLAIAFLTWKAAFRFRLFLVLLVLLLGSVGVLPLLLKDDGTAQGFIQILLTYNLTVITALLGFSTLWLSCGTLARDIEDCQIQVLASKPVSRWQIWLGKWVGIMMLNAVLLTVTGAKVYGLLQWRGTDLPEQEQFILDNEIFVARAAIREPAPDLNETRDRIFQERIERTPVDPAQYDFVRDQIMDQLKAGMQVVPPNHYRKWSIDFGMKANQLRDEPLFIRFKFHVAETNLAGLYMGLWDVGPPESPLMRSFPQRHAANTFHEIPIPPNLLDSDGVLNIQFINQNDTSLLFTLEEGLEVLYREGGFGVNYLRGFLVIFSWMGFLAALGLAAAGFLSFPVAAFFTLSLMLIGLSSGTLTGAVEEDTVAGRDHETGQVQGGAAVLDAVLIPVFKVVLGLVGVVDSTSPVHSLSTGRSITWGQVGMAWIQIVGVMGGAVAVGGLIMFYRRELALPQGGS